MNEGVLTTPVGWRETVKDYLSLERNVSIASAAVFLLGFGEELWKKFIPKYLEALGASIPVIGIFGTARISSMQSISIRADGLPTISAVARHF